MQAPNSHALGGARMKRFVLVAFTAALLTTTALAQDAPPPTEGEHSYSPYPEKTFPNSVYFGDTHLHTSYSTDAGMIGNALGPDEAYRFARGEEVIQSHGLRVKSGMGTEAYNEWIQPMSAR